MLPGRTKLGCEKGVCQEAEENEVNTKRPLGAIKKILLKKGPKGRRTISNKPNDVWY